MGDRRRDDSTWDDDDVVESTHARRRTPTESSRSLPSASERPERGKLSRRTPHATMGIGAWLGEYEILRLIGRGGVGSVYEVKHLGHGRRFAAKVITRRVDEVRLRRLRREARVTGALHHPNIVEVVELGRAEPYGVNYIVMELLMGSDLGEHLCERPLDEPWLPMDETRVIGHQLLDGLATAHAGGIVHRDLKPENIFLADKPYGRVVKILDFGLAKGGGTPTGGLRLTGEFQIVGTPAYMAPEQARTSNVDQRADVYATAVILHELLTGRRPYDVKSPSDVLARLALEKPGPPSALRAGIPAAVDAVVLRGLERRPSQRFADAGEMLAAWDAAWESLPEGVNEPAPAPEAAPEPEPARAPYRSQRALLLATVGLALPLMAALIYLLAR